MDPLKLLFEIIVNIMGFLSKPAYSVSEVLAAALPSHCGEEQSPLHTLYYVLIVCTLFSAIRLGH